MRAEHLAPYPFNYRLVLLFWRRGRMRLLFLLQVLLLLRVPLHHLLRLLLVLLLYLRFSGLVVLLGKLLMFLFLLCLQLLPFLRLLPV